jgi:hypothetical protein
MLTGEWGTEEREGGLVLKQGAEFSIDIYCEDDGFKVCNTQHNNKYNNNNVNNSNNNNSFYSVKSLKYMSANPLIIFVSSSPLSHISSSPKLNRMLSVEVIFFSNE